MLLTHYAMAEHLWMHAHAATADNGMRVQGVSLKRVPELVVLQGPEESASSLAHCPAEALLLRWAAYHLAQPAARSLAGHEVCFSIMRHQ